MQLQQFASLLLLAVVAISCLASATPSRQVLRDADDDKRMGMCQRFPMSKPDMKLQLKPCLLCCYEHDRQVDEPLSKQTKNCICGRSAEFEDDDNEDNEGYDVEDDDEDVQQVATTAASE